MLPALRQADGVVRAAVALALVGLCPGVSVREDAVVGAVSLHQIAGEGAAPNNLRPGATGAVAGGARWAAEAAGPAGVVVSSVARQSLLPGIGAHGGRGGLGGAAGQGQHQEGQQVAHPSSLPQHSAMGVA
jgi:hypothetical protein